MAARLWAHVEVSARATDELPYRAWEGMPEGEQRPMPTPAVLVIDERPDGFYLIGHAIDGAFAGDTWHRSLEEAQEQAAFAHGPYLGPWEPVPEDVEDPAVYALAQLGK